MHQNDDCAREWLESNRLVDRVHVDDDAVVPIGDVFFPIDAVIGESFVRYVVELLTPLGFLETLPDWGSRPAELVKLYESGWRESLGLSPECNAEQGDSE